MMPVVRIPDPVFERLQAIATPFVDTPASVIEKLLDFYAANQGTAPLGRAQSTLPSRPTVPRLDPDTPPELLHSRVLSAEFDGRRAANWNELMMLAHRHAMGRLKSLEVLRAATMANVVSGRRSDSGFHYQPEINASIQNVDSNHAWRYSLHLAKRLGVPIRAAFEWRHRKGASRPGEQGSLAWAPAGSDDEA